jgi:iron complex outermembrane receptor protein
VQRVPSRISRSAPPAAAAPAPTASSVPSERANGPVAGFVASRSATGTKTDTPLIETPQSVSVVTADQISALGARTPSEALRYTAGVQVERFGGDPRFDWIKIRGFDVNEYMDGLQLPKGNYAWSRIDPYGLERIEVLKGPASVLYGQSPPGGLVNFVTKKPLDEARNEVRIGGGSYGRVETQFDFTGPANADKTVLYRIVGSGRISDTIVDYVNEDHFYIAPSLTFRPTEDTTLTVLGHYGFDDTKSLQFLPSQGTLYVNPFGRIPRSRFLGEPGYDNFRREEFSIGYQFEHRFNDAVTIRQNLRYGGVDVDLPVIRGFGFPRVDGMVDYRNVTRRIVRFDDSITGFTVDNQLQVKGETGPLSHTILAGIDYRIFDTGFATRNSLLTPNFDVFFPVYGRPLPNPALTARISQSLEQTGIYLQDQIKLDSWVLMLSVRQDWLNNKTSDQVVGRIIDQPADAFTYRAGLLYNFDNGLAPYVSYSTLFQPAVGVGAGNSPPSLGTTGAGAPFVPTTGDQIEGGVKYQIPGTSTLFTASVFRLNQDNVLVADATNVGRQRQLGAARAEGFEFEGKAMLADGLDFVSAYSYLETKQNRTSILAQLGKELPATPMHQAAGFLNYTFPGGPLMGLSLGGGVRYVGSSWGDLPNTIRIPSYTLVDAAIRYDLAALWPAMKGAQISVNATNLFDKRFVSTCGDLNTCYYGPPRQVLASFSYRW